MNHTGYFFFCIAQIWASLQTDPFRLSFGFGLSTGRPLSLVILTLSEVEGEESPHLPAAPQHQKAVPPWGQPFCLSFRSAAEESTSVFAFTDHLPLTTDHSPYRMAFSTTSPARTTSISRTTSV